MLDLYQEAKESFGTSKNGEAVSVYLLQNKNGMKVRVTDYGEIGRAHV